MNPPQLGSSSRKVSTPEPFLRGLRLPSSKNFIGWLVGCSSTTSSAQFTMHVFYPVYLPSRGPVCTRIDSSKQSFADKNRSTILQCKGRTVDGKKRKVAWQFVIMFCKLLWHHTMYVKQCDCLKHYLCMATWTGCYNWQFGRIEKMSKISFFVVTPAQSCWTVVDSTKSVSAELSDFGLWRQLKVESKIKSPWTLKTILNDIKNILY
jgi:hypothetical protein